MQEDIRFLKELQRELKTQETDCQASPRFWVVGDYKMIPCPDGFHDEYHVYSSNKECSIEINELLKEITNDNLAELSEEARGLFEEIGCEVTAIEWLRKYWSEDAELVPVKKEHFICPNTMFITKAEAKEHIRRNHYHYSSEAHTYAMTAWRSPKVEKLLKILETLDWADIETDKEHISKMAQRIKALEQKLY